MKKKKGWVYWLCIGWWWEPIYWICFGWWIKIFKRPSLKSRIKARTTGKLKRKVKKAIIPGYGKKKSWFL